MCYHMNRKMPSIIKSTLNPMVEFDAFGDPINPTAGWFPFSMFVVCMFYVLATWSLLPSCS